jgi:hypothetical protein
MTKTARKSERKKKHSGHVGGFVEIRERMDSDAVTNHHLHCINAFRSRQRANSLKYSRRAEVRLLCFIGAIDNDDEEK